MIVFKSQCATMIMFGCKLLMKLYNIHVFSTNMKTAIVDVVFHDFSKAFDKLPHRYVSVKLFYNNINGSTLIRVNNFLRNRVQAVSFNVFHST